MAWERQAQEALGRMEHLVGLLSEGVDWQAQATAGADATSEVKAFDLSLLHALRTTFSHPALDRHDYLSPRCRLLATSQHADGFAYLWLCQADMQWVEG